MENAVTTLSTDIHVITAEIKVEIARVGESIYRIGERLLAVRSSPLVYGFNDYRDWEKWCHEEFNMTRQHANRFIKVVEQLGTSMFRNTQLGVAALYEIATMPEEQREQPHTIPSTGETKTVDEMTVRELREVKAELKRKQAELDAAKRSEQIALTQTERLSDELAFATKPETVVVEKEVERSIEVNGIRDAIKCTPAFTVISGHQRLRIAKDLDLTEVPVEIIDVDEWEAEYLLIAENVERRGQAEQDPIKKAHIAQFLKEWWGVKRGGDRAKEQNAPLKTLDDIGEFIGEDKYTTKRILKLNDLIPQLQRLVSSGKIGTTSAEQLAYLTPEVQTALYDALGEEIGERTVAQTKQLRTEAQGKSPDK